VLDHLWQRACKHYIIVTLKRVRESDKWQKESPPAESRGSEQTPLHFKLSLREESRCGWIYSSSQTWSTVYV